MATTEGETLMLRLSMTYENRSVTLENVTSVTIIGDNGIGKTAFLERIALMNEDNINTILNVKGSFSYEKFSVRIDDDEKRCERVGAGRVRLPYSLFPYAEGHTYICEGNIGYKISIVYPYAFLTPIHNEHFGLFVKPNDEVMKFNEIIKEFIDGTVVPFRSNYIYQDFVYQNGDNILYLHNLGRGISNLVNLLWHVYKYKPDILLIDDIETLSLSPKRLKMLLKWLVEYIRDDKLKAMLFTTNSDAYVHLAEVDENAKFLLLQKDNHIIMDRKEVLDRLDKGLV